MRKILVIGATGLLGKPVAAAMTAGGLAVRAMVRSPRRAAGRLPAGCEVVTGDLRDPATIRAAMAGVDAVYLSLSERMLARRPAWDPDAEGTRAVVEAAAEVGVGRILRISSLGVDDPRATWWVARSKAETDRVLRESGVPYTIFRPNWFFESIAISVFGPLVLRFPAPDLPLRWLAADDYAKQVIAALRRPDAANRTYECQGPEPIAMRAAFARFARALGGLRLSLPLPSPALRLGARLSGRMAYLGELLRFTFPIWSEVGEGNAAELHRPVIGLEEYVRRLRASGEWPRKSMGRPGRDADPR